MIPRKVKPIIDKFLKNEDILLIIGARQVGKTTILMGIEDELKTNGSIVFSLTLEDPELLGDLDKHPENLFHYVRRTEKRIYILIDEIQYLRDPSNFLKYHYDKYRKNIKLIVTGSSAFYIDHKFKDSLAGRKRIIEIYPFSFSEFLSAKNMGELAAQIQSAFVLGQKRRLLKPERRLLWQMWQEYSLYGGYPKVVLEDDNFEKISLLQELVLSFLKKDVLESGIKEDAKFYKLVRVLASQSGQLVNANELGRTLEMSKDTVSRYLYVLQKSFIVKSCPPFYRNIRKELTKMPKIFFYDNGYRNYLINDFSHFSRRMDTGAYLENAIFGEMAKSGIENIKFWRTQSKKEIDFIVNEKRAFEIKISKQSFSRSKYREFKEIYSEIPLEPVVAFDDEILDALDFTS